MRFDTAEGDRRTASRSIGSRVEILPIELLLPMLVRPVRRSNVIRYDVRSMYANTINSNELFFSS